MASRTRKTIELFYDVVSPYSWIGFEMMCRYSARWNINLKLRPFFLGGIMAGSENKPPGFVPAKFRYMGFDLQRLANHYGVPLRMPEDPANVIFNKGSLSAMRFITAVDKKKPEYTEELSRQFWRRIWQKDEDITEPESFIKAAQCANIDEAVIKEAIENITKLEIKDLLKKATQEALDYGAFGSPTFVVHDEQGDHMIFGSDRFHILADMLGEKYEGPLLNLSKL